MRKLLFATAALATLGLATACFAGGPTGGVGTSDTMTQSQTASAGSQIWGVAVQPPGGGKGGYPARLSNGCPAPGTRQDTGGSLRSSC